MVIGCDYSMVSPGLCIFGKSLKPDPKNFTLDMCHFFSLSNYDIPDFDNFHFQKHDNWTSEMERFGQISDWVIKVLFDFQFDDNARFCLENYSMGSRGKVFNIGENTGILKYKLWLYCIDVRLIAPTVVKKSATGKGTATKDIMYEQFLKDTGFDLKSRIQPNRKLGSPTTDLVDAFYLAKCGFMSQNV